MRKLMFVLVLILPVLSASAQLGMKKTRVAAKSPEVIAAAVANNLDAKLALAGDQKTKISALAVESIKQVRAIRLLKVDDKAKKQKVEQLAKDHATKLRALLKPDQFAKLDALKKKAAQVSPVSAIPAEDEAAADLKQVLE